MNRAAIAVILLFAAFGAHAQSTDAETGAHTGAQCAADILKQTADADGAFIAAGEVNSSFDPKNLASLIQLPLEKISVVSLKGSEIKQAFERSISLYPQPNTSFLQISGFTVDFKGSGLAATRIVSIQAGDAPLDLRKTYKVAMPAGLAEGAMGYFKIWDKSKIAKTMDVTLEQALKGKPLVASSPRWVLR